MDDKYLFFDLDGTLTDSMLGITNSVKFALGKLGRPIPEERILRRFLGPPLVESFQNYCHMDEEEAAQAVAVYREYFSTKGLYENQVYPGIPELLSELRQRGFVLAVATSKPELFSVTIMKHFALESQFRMIAGSSMDNSRNTKEAVIRYAMEKLNIQNTDEVVMIGDREHDVFGARACGIPCIGVLWGYGDKKELIEAGAAAVIAGPEELPKLLEEDREWRKGRWMHV